MAPIRRRAALALATTAVLATVASDAHAAATVTVTDDAGVPRVINPAAPPTIRQMKPDVGLSFPEPFGRYKLAITDGAGNRAGVGVDCLPKNAPQGTRVDYHGNGPYVITVVNYVDADTACRAPQSTEQYGFYVTASTVVTPPAGPVLLREPGDLELLPVSVNVGLNPGADDYDVQYALRGVPGPDGGLTGPLEHAFVNPSTGATRLAITRPGVYTVVARARHFGSGGDTYGPYSAPAKVVVCAPFDLVASGEFLDADGPSYRMRWTVRERSATGWVNVAVARGAKGGHFHALGRARLSHGRFSKRFTLVRGGRYRLRLTYKGSRLVAAGGAIDAIQVSRAFVTAPK